MHATFSIYGDGFKAYDFLLEAIELPFEVTLWDDKVIDDLQSNEGGFTLNFTKKETLVSLPFSLGRFLMGNRKLLKSPKYFKKGVFKDLSIIIEHADVKKLANKSGPIIFIMNPGLHKLLGELEIHFYITKLGDK